jgi:hypothetical protein
MPLHESPCQPQPRCNRLWVAARAPDKPVQAKLHARALKLSQPQRRSPTVGRFPRPACAFFPAGRECPCYTTLGIKISENVLQGGPWRSYTRPRQSKSGLIARARAMSGANTAVPSAAPHRISRLRGSPHHLALFHLPVHRVVWMIGASWPCGTEDSGAMPKTSLFCNIPSSVTAGQMAAANIYCYITTTPW